jgi:hypothetical protein
MAVPAIVWSVILMVVKWLSPVARTAFEVAMQNFYRTAMESENQMDDVAATVLCKVLGVDVSGVEYTKYVGTQTAPAEVMKAVTGGLVEVATGRPFDPSIDSGP